MQFLLQYASLALTKTTFVATSKYVIIFKVWFQFVLTIFLLTSARQNIQDVVDADDEEEEDDIDDEIQDIELKLEELVGLDDLQVWSLIFFITVHFLSQKIGICA